MSRAAGPRVVLAALCCGLAGLWSGCGVGAGETADGVSLRVTDDFGRVPVAAPKEPKQSGEDTVMRLLQRNTKVKTRYSGGFVQEIDGRAGYVDAKEQVDWFYYVNGVLAERGAASWKLRTGDRVWWDRHRWDTAQISAVVGSYPEPFLSGHEARYRGALLDCRASSDACQFAEEQLTAEGITVERGDASTAPDSRTHLIVGPWPKIRTVEAEEFRTIERSGPRASGIFAQLSKAGDLTLFGKNGEPEGEAEPRGTGLIAAMHQGNNAPVWIVTGRDESAVRRALQDGLTKAALAGRMAVAVGPQGGVRSLPLVDPVGPDRSPRP